MAQITFGSIGSASVASGVVTEQDQFVNFDGINAVNSRPFEVAQLPHYFFWVSSPVAGVNVTVQMAVRDLAIAGTPDWKNLTAPIALAAGVPAVIELRFPARFVRLQVSAVAPLANPTTIDFIMAAASGI